MSNAQPIGLFFERFLGPCELENDMNSTSSLLIHFWNYVDPGIYFFASSQSGQIVQEATLQYSHDENEGVKRGVGDLRCCRRLRTYRNQRVRRRGRAS